MSLSPKQANEAWPPALGQGSSNRALWTASLPHQNGRSQSTVFLR